LVTAVGILHRIQCKEEKNLGTLAVINYVRNSPAQDYMDDHDCVQNLR